jgi:hypothetical protein
MRKKVRAILESLLARTERTITLDELGDAIGQMPITQDEIDALMRALEEAGREITSEDGATAERGASTWSHGEETLKRVLDAARVMKASGRTPSPLDLARATGLPIGRVKNALALARVIGR